jgi:hypothetical protein
VLNLLEGINIALKWDLDSTPLLSKECHLSTTSTKSANNSVSALLIVGSNSTRLHQAFTDMGINTVSMDDGGWAISRTSVEAVLPKLAQWYTHKTSGFKTSGFKTFGFKTSETSGLQNVRFTKRHVYKTSGLQNVRLRNVRFQNVLTSKYFKTSVSKKNVDLTYFIPRSDCSLESKCRTRVDSQKTCSWRPRREGRTITTKRRSFYNLQAYRAELLLISKYPK